MKFFECRTTYAFCIKCGFYVLCGVLLPPRAFTHLERHMCAEVLTRKRGCNFCVPAVADGDIFIKKNLWTPILTFM